jgi:general secretion pathway protein J
MSGREAAGFTLIELLVALTVLALISMVLFGGLRFGARAWETGTATIEHTVAVETAQDLLRRTIAGAEAADPKAPDPKVPNPKAPDLKAPTNRPLFAGGPDRLTLVAAIPGHAGIGGLARYTLLREPAGALALAWEIYRPDRAEDGDRDQPAQVLENTSGLALSYYGSLQPGAAPEWQDHWDDPGILPLLIRIDVAFPPQDGRVWPTLVIAPRLARIPVR